jgi:hypothetical protein
MLSDSDQRRMAKDLRVIANGVRLPGWIFLILLAMVLMAALSISALLLCKFLLKAFF